MARSKKSITPPTRKNPPRAASQPMPDRIACSGSCAHARTYRQYKTRRQFLSHHVVSNHRPSMSKKACAGPRATVARRTGKELQEQTNFGSRTTTWTPSLRGFRFQQVQATGGERRDGKVVIRDQKFRRRRRGRSCREEDLLENAVPFIGLFLIYRVQFAPRGVPPPEAAGGTLASVRIGARYVPWQGHLNFTSHGDLKILPRLALNRHGL